MSIREKLEQGGYRKIGQTHGAIAEALFYNPNTDDWFTVIVDDVDDYGKFKPELYRMPVDETLYQVYRRKRGIIRVGDTVEVYKGRKIPRGTIAVVVREYDWRDCYGRVRTHYVVFEDGRKTNVENCRLV